jgi:regulator of protease activity HflC (stomatin/prohibitin superfamily)
MIIETLGILGIIGIIVGLVALYFISCIRFIYEYERGVVFRLGRILPHPKGPGIIMVFYPIDHLVRISLRTRVNDVPAQDVITRDNVTVKVNAVVYFRVIDPHKAILEVEDYLYATNELSQTTLRSILGQSELDELLAERDRINQHLQEVIDNQTDPWGIKVSAVEVKDVDLPETMKRAMARQAESERERRAKVIHAEGEFQASTKLRDAAKIIEGHPMAMQMRFLQTLADVGTENNTTLVFPIPIDLLSVFYQKNGNAKENENQPEASRSIGRPGNEKKKRIDGENL